MPIKKTAIYGLFAVLYIAKNNNGKPIQGREIARVYDIPEEYLLKVLQILARGRILKSARGRSGGFELGRSASLITLDEIVAVLDPVDGIADVLDRTLSGHEDVKSCLSDAHARATTQFRESLSSITVQRLAELDSETVAAH